MEVFDFFLNVFWRFLEFFWVFFGFFGGFWRFLDVFLGVFGCFWGVISCIAISKTSKNEGGPRVFMLFLGCSWLVCCFLVVSWLLLLSKPRNFQPTNPSARDEVDLQSGWPRGIFL